MPVKRGVRAVLMLLAVNATGCALAGEPEGPFADLRGTWTFTGRQAAPALQLNGTLVFSGQDAEQVVGSLSWQEVDGVGVIVTRGGPASGTVIGMTDVDFAVSFTDGERRFVAEVRADTLVGVWAGAPTSASGQFRAERIR